MMYKRYAGEFAGTDGTLWRVEIHEDSETAFSTVGELSFPYDEPLLIEWEKKAKEEVIQGSSATLKLISPGDRTYVDLYSVKPCAVRLDVYRAGALYWRGTLDTELYEEPYESASGYTVSLTFSDFGVLARKKLYGHEVQSLRAILERALEAAGLAGMEIYDGYISSRVVPAARLVPETNGPTGASSQAEAGLFDELYVSGDNFYDEDGEAITAEEVVEGVLQPLALRMIQCGGLVYVYDLNGLHAGAEKVMLEWAGATQTLGTDRVYNNVRVKWSPYVRTGNLLETDCWTAAVDEGLTDFGPEYILDGGRPSADGKCRYTTYHYTTDSDVWGDETDAGFTLWTSRTGKNADLTDERVRYFKVVPQNGGTECEGVAVMYTAVGMYGDSSDKSMVLGCMGVMPDELHAGTPKGVLFKTRLVPLTNGPTGADSQAAAGALPVDEGLYVKVTAELLLDARSNPFETAGEWMEGARERTYQEQWNRYGNFVYVPVCVKWKDAGDIVMGCDKLPDSGLFYPWDITLHKAGYMGGSPSVYPYPAKIGVGMMLFQPAHYVNGERREENARYVDRLWLRIELSRLLYDEETGESKGGRSLTFEDGYVGEPPYFRKYAVGKKGTREITVEETAPMEIKLPFIDWRFSAGMDYRIYVKGAYLDNLYNKNLYIKEAVFTCLFHNYGYPPVNDWY